MEDDPFAIEATWRAGALAWRLHGHLGRRAALILAELGPMFTLRVPVELSVRLDGVSGYESSGAAVLRLLLAELAERGIVVRVDGGLLPLRRLVQPGPVVAGSALTRPCLRWARGFARA